MYRTYSWKMLLVWNFERHKAVQETSVAEVLCSEVYFKTLLTFTGLFSCKQSNTFGTVFCPYCKCQNPSQVCHCRLLLISPLRRTGSWCSAAADKLFYFLLWSSKLFTDRILLPIDQWQVPCIAAGGWFVFKLFGIYSIAGWRSLDGSCFIAVCITLNQ